MLKAWIFLLIAIVFEVAGVSVLNYSGSEYQLYAYISLYVMICISYYFMSLAILKISVGIAYALWEVVGISLITLISLIFFQVHLSTQQYIGLGLAALGILLVNLGEVKNENKEVKNA